MQDEYALTSAVSVGTDGTITVTVGGRVHRIDRTALGQ